MNLTDLIIKLVEARNWVHERGESMRGGTISEAYYSGYEDGLDLALSHIRKLEAPPPK